MYGTAKSSAQNVVHGITRMNAIASFQDQQSNISHGTNGSSPVH